MLTNKKERKGALGFELDEQYYDADISLIFRNKNKYIPYIDI